MNISLIDEIVDVVNEYDIVIAQIPRSQANVHKINGFFRCVIGVIKDRQSNTFCFFRRSPKLFYKPLHIACAGGWVQAGENYEAALIREINEEAGINVTQFPYRLLTIMHPNSVSNHTHFKGVYEIITPRQNIVMNEDDAIESLWLTPEELAHRAKHDLVMPDLVQIMQKFYPDACSL